MTITHYDGLSKISNLGSGDSYYFPEVFNSNLFDKINAEVTFSSRDDVKIGMYGKIFKFRRDICLMGETFKYSLINPPDHVPFTPSVKFISTSINDIFEQKTNSSIVNRYVKIDDYIGSHKDKTTTLVSNSLIFCVSFGAIRVFRLKNGQKIQHITVRPGSVIVLGPRTNREFKHEVLPGQGTRISVTLRTVK